MFFRNFFAETEKMTPHIIIKGYPGRTQAQKEALADAITHEVFAVAGCAESSVSVAIE
jgi:4-oxalocrotonate tautomerase